MKFYVAGRWEDREKIRLIQSRLISLGCKLTLDWTNHEYPEGDLLILWAVADIKAVREADFVVALMEEIHDYKGAWCEIGASLALGRRVYILGDGGNSCIFSHHPLIRKIRSLDEIKY